LHGPLTIGRSPECDICIGEGGLSRLHARLVPRDDGVLIEDLDSTNGSFVNDRRVRRHKACIGDEIGFDKVRFRLVGSGACASDHAGPARPRPALQAPGQYALWARATTIGALLLALASVAALAAQYYL
jgi:pSer/pThr/pTyr-binding forkhead associated (FHA) protein